MKLRSEMSDDKLFNAGIIVLKNHYEILFNDCLTRNEYMKFIIHI
jgi:hypothetical protein